MKAVIIKSHGGPDVLEYTDIPVPEPAPGEVRIKVHAVGLNHLDIWVRKGLPHLKINYPHLLGSDIAGEIDALGEGVDGLETGAKAVVHPATSCGKCPACLSGNDNLCSSYKILGENTSGGYAQFVCVPAVNVLKHPEKLSYEEAASVLLPCLTAYQMIRKTRLKRGEDVLIQAAGSGVSSAAIQIAKAKGARIIVTAGVEEKLEKAKALGAHDVINYKTEDFAKKVRQLTAKKGVEVILDHVGQDVWESNIKSLAWGGRLAICGATSGFNGKTNLTLLFFKQLELIGSTMGTRSDMLSVLQLVNDGLLKPVIYKSLPLEKAAEAHGILEERKAFGRVILRPH